MYGQKVLDVWLSQILLKQVIFMHRFSITNWKTLSVEILCMIADYVVHILLWKMLQWWLVNSIKVSKYARYTSLPEFRPLMWLVAFLRVISQFTYLLGRTFVFLCCKAEAHPALNGLHFLELVIWDYGCWLTRFCCNHTMSSKHPHPHTHTHTYSHLS